MIQKKHPDATTKKNTHFQHRPQHDGFHCHPLRGPAFEGTEAIGDPKDVLLAENGTLFVSDEASHLGVIGKKRLRMILKDSQV